MVLVSYSDSESDADDAPSRSEKIAAPTAECLIAKPIVPSKRKAESFDVALTKTPSTAKPPPLPASFHSLYSTNVRMSTTDDPSLHGGRKRQITHVAGNWPSHVYLEWLPTKLQLAHLDTVIQQAQQHLETYALTRSELKQNLTLQTFLRSSLSAQLPLHISLSAPLVLDTDRKDEFRERLVEKIRHARIGMIAVRLTTLDLVPNFDKSRWFLVVRVAESDADIEGTKLAKILQVCNDVCKEFGLAGLYENGEGIGVDIAKSTRQEDRAERAITHERGEGSCTVGAFHVSVAWMLDEVPEEIRDAVRQIELKELQKDAIELDRVKSKIGNKVDDIMLV